MEPIQHNIEEVVVLDTETAGLSKEEGVVEIAWVTIDDHLNVLSEFCTRVNPPGPVSPSAAGVHKITKDMVKDCPSLEQVMAEAGSFMADKEVLIIGHNASFDIKYVEPFIGRVRKLCTLKLARLAFPKDTEGQEEWYVPPPDHKLSTMMYYLNLQVKGSHNALDDVYTSLQLLQKCCEKLDLDLEGAFYLCNQPQIVKKMPFGKHEGQPTATVPTSYITWLYGDVKKKGKPLDEDLKYTLDKVLTDRGLPIPA